MNLEIRKKEIADRLIEIRGLAEKENNISELEKLETDRSLFKLMIMVLR